METPTWKHFSCDRCQFVGSVESSGGRVDLYRCGYLWLVRHGGCYDDYFVTIGHRLVSLLATFEPEED